MEGFGRERTDIRCCFNCHDPSGCKQIWLSTDSFMPIIYELSSLLVKDNDFLLFSPWLAVISFLSLRLVAIQLYMKPTFEGDPLPT